MAPPRARGLQVREAHQVAKRCVHDHGVLKLEAPDKVAVDDRLHALPRAALQDGLCGVQHLHTDTQLFALCDEVLNGLDVWQTHRPLLVCVGLLLQNVGDGGLLLQGFQQLLRLDQLGTLLHGILCGLENRRPEEVDIVLHASLLKRLLDLCAFLNRHAHERDTPLPRTRRGHVEGQRSNGLNLFLLPKVGVQVNLSPLFYLVHPLLPIQPLLQIVNLFQELRGSKLLDPLVLGYVLQPRLPDGVDDLDQLVQVLVGDCCPHPCHDGELHLQLRPPRRQDLNLRHLREMQVGEAREDFVDFHWV
mmetsp:Transcript_96215/g.271949  ORF Transcript_96215/g.271949 Transcript_96215/m.271949 type:complete len:304 (-) Transcript_96215:1300-2211(-)